MIFAIVVVGLGLATVPSVTLSNGLQMPLVHCGTGGETDASATDVVHLALAAGFTGIDTAHDYNCLRGVGNALAALAPGKREDLFVTTKVPGCGVPTQGLQPPCYDNTHKVFAADMEKLQTPFVDLLLLHFPPLLGCDGERCSKVQEQWTALEELYQARAERTTCVAVWF